LTEEEFIDRLNHALHDTSDVEGLGGVGGGVGGLIPNFIRSQSFEKPPIVTSVKTGRYAFPLTLT